MNQNARKKNNSKQVVITDNNAGQRIDNFLIRYFGKIPNSRIYQMLRKGEVRVNGGRIKQNYKLKNNDAVRIPPVYLFEKQTLKPNKSIQKKKLDSIIFEDEGLVVINKPTGIVVHSGSRQSYGVIEIFRTIGGGYESLELAHRLDKDTTGIMVIARTIESHAFLVEELQKRNIKRNYRAIICGQLVAGGKIENRIGRHPTYRTKMAVNNKGKLATTHYKIIKKYQHYTYLDIQLGTGRTHQIRVHMNSIKHPIIGDPLYGKNTFIRKGICASLREDIKSFRRQALHAHNLEFIHPSKKKIVSYKAELPDDMKTLIKTLEIND